MHKAISWISSFLTVATLFCGFWSLCYIEVNFSWGGLMGSLGLAFFFWLGTAFFYALCGWAEWKEREKTREREAVRKMKERK